jgi:hypothetical protein
VAALVALLSLPTTPTATQAVSQRHRRTSLANGQDSLFSFALERQGTAAAGLRLVALQAAARSRRTTLSAVRPEALAVWVLPVAMLLPRGQRRQLAAVVVAA